MERENLADFLRQSNAIEMEYSEEAFEDSVIAWDYAVDNYDDLGMGYVCEVHERLMKRLNSKIAGKLRRKKVYLCGRDGNGLRVVIDEFEVKGNKPRLRKWCERYKDVRELGKMKEAHIDFEMIHPFLDGNGRTGRILYNVQRVVAGFDVEVFWEARKWEYYEWFNEERRRRNLIKLLLNKKN